MQLSKIKEVIKTIIDEREFKTQFIDREKEIATLQGLLKEVLQGVGYLVLIEGETGIGKSRLVEELRKWAEDALDKELRFLSSKCLYHGSGDPYLPFMDALRGYYEQRDSARDVSSISTVPGSPLTGARAGAKIIDLRHLQQERDRMFGNITQLITNIAEEMPLILFLDDIHWADNPSLQLLQYLARNTKSVGVLIIGAYRPEELQKVEGKAHPLIDIMHRMSRENLITKITLNRFDLADVTTMIGSIFEYREIPKEFIEQIYETTEGNPYFIEEVIRSLIEEKIIDYQDNDGYEKIDLGPIKIPETIRDVVVRRINRLNDDSIKILRYAALIGRVFDYRVLFKVAEMDEERLLDCLDELIGARLIHEDLGMKEERYKFDNTVISDVAYEDLSRSRKRVIHRKVGEVLEELNKANIDAVIYDLARHFYRGKYYGKAVTYLMRAGETAESLYALEEAQNYYKLALNGLSNLEGEESLENKQQKITLFSRLGKISQIIGKWQRAVGYHGQTLVLLEETKNDLKKVESEPRELGDFSPKLLRKSWLDERAAEANRAMGYIKSHRSEWDDALECYDQALEISMRINDFYGVAESNRGLGYIYWRNGEYDDAIAHYERGIENIEKIRDHQDPSITGVVYIELGNVYNSKGDWEKAIEYYDKSIGTLEKVGDLREMGRAYNNLGDIYMQRDELEKALKYFERSESTSKKIGNTYMMAWASFNQAECYAKLDEFEKALEKNDMALELLTPLEDKVGVSAISRNYGTIYRFMHDWDNAIKYFEDSLKILSELDVPFEMGYAYYEYGLMYKDKGDAKKAKENIKKALECFEKVGAKKRIEMIESEWPDLK